MELTFNSEYEIVVVNSDKMSPIILRYNKKNGHTWSLNLNKCEWVRVRDSEKTPEE